MIGLSLEKGRFLRNEYRDEFIFISDNLTKKEEKIVLSHELGHLILDTELSISFYSSSLVSHNKLELQANQKAKYGKTKSLDIIIMSKDKKIKELEEENKKLKEQLAILRGNLYEKM